MKVKKSNGLAGIDMVIAVIAVLIFSTLIISMMYSNVLENVKLKKETLAMIYITEIFENIGIASYNDVTEENINNFIPEEVSQAGYQVDMDVRNVANNEDILKKIEITLTYQITDKTYTCSMQRMKIKE